jgi:hypothetical protein
MDNDDKGFQMIIFEQHANWSIRIEKWLPRNDMGNVDHLPTYLPTSLPIPYFPSYNLPITYLIILQQYEIIMWNKNLTKIWTLLMV